MWRTVSIGLVYSEVGIC